MIHVSVTLNTTNLTESDLKQLSQLGVDYLDFGVGHSFAGVKEQGYPDLDQLLQLRRRIRSWGMDINRVTLPNISERFMENRPGSEQELEHSLSALKVFGEAGIPIVRQRFAGDVFEGMTMNYKSEQRGGAVGRGESLGFMKEKKMTRTLEQHQSWWLRFRDAYRSLVPVAEDYGVKIAMHPSDSPLPDTPFNGLGMHHLMDDFPNKNVGFVYCIGTRAEAGGSSLVLDEINHYGRKGRIFLVHFRNVRGSLPTAGGFEEAMLDDGDMNMFRILLELNKVGYSGCINPDHVLIMDGDQPDLHEGFGHSNVGWKASSVGFAYAIGYIRACLTALTEFEGRRY